MSDFKKWATSFSGIDGGNVNGEYWIVGIEFACGGDGEYEFLRRCGKNNNELQERKEFKDNNINFSNYQSSEYNSFKAVEEYPNEFLVKKQKPIGYNNYVQKLCEKLLEEVISDNNEIDVSGYYIKKYFKEDGSFFKFNLFSIPFPKDDNSNWETYYSEEYRINLFNTTGFSDKDQYRNFCFSNRLPKLLKDFLNNNNQDHLKIILNSSKYYCLFIETLLKTDFIECIPISETIDSNYLETNPKCIYSFKTYKRKNGKYISVIKTPFLTRAGGYKGIKALADKIKTINIEDEIS